MREENEVKFFRKKRPLGNGEEDYILTEAVIGSGKRLLNFVAIQLYRPQERDYQIKKHDFSHGIYNVHKYYERLDSREEIPEERLTMDLFKRCKMDIVENWFDCRERYRKKYILRRTQ